MSRQGQKMKNSKKFRRNWKILKVQKPKKVKKTLRKEY